MNLYVMMYSLRRKLRCQTRLGKYVSDVLKLLKNICTSYTFIPTVPVKGLHTPYVVNKKVLKTCFMVSSKCPNDIFAHY